MKIVRLHPIGFGKFLDCTFDFAPGFNLVFGSNEAGKSTLISFMESMFYGLKREGVTKKFYLDQYDLYGPWDSQKYEGRLTFSLADGRNLEVFRRFDKESELITVHDNVLGKDLNASFEVDRRGELLFANKLFSMPRSVFINTVIVHQLALGKGFGDSTSELSATLIKAVSGARKDEGSSSALSILNKALDAIGKTERGKRSGELLENISYLEGILVEAKEHQEKLSSCKIELLEKQRELAETTRGLEALEKSKAIKRVDHLDELISKAEELTTAIDAEAKSIDEFRDFKDFPIAEVDDVKRLEQEKSHFQDMLSEKNKKLEETDTELADLKKKLKNIKAYKDLPENSDEEMLELKIRWFQAEDNVRSIGSHVASEIDKTKKKNERLEELEELFSAIGEDAPDRLQQLTNEEELLTQELLELSDQTSRESIQQGPQRALAMALSLLSVFAAVGSTALKLIDYFNIMATGFAWLPLIIIAIVSLFFSLLFRSRGGRISEDIHLASRKYEALQEKRKELRKERSTLLSLAGVKTVQEFIELHAVYKSLHESLASNSIMIQQKRLPKLEDEAGQLRDRILAKLRQVGLCEDYDDPREEDVKTYLKNFSQARELSLKLKEKIAAHAEIIKDLKKFTKQESALSDELKDIYRGADSRNLTEFLAKAEKRRMFDKHISSQERRKENLNNLLQGKKIEDLVNERDKLRSFLEQFEDTDESGESIDVSEMKNAQERSEELTAEINHLKGTVETLLSSDTDPGMIELEINSAREELERIRFRRESLNLAISHIKEATEQLHAHLAPVLNKEMSALSEKLTGNRYKTVMIDDSFKISVREPDSDAIIPLNSLSNGTRDQLYFAARLALADALTQGKEPLPLILDDSFVEYDRERTANALELLKSVSQSRQVILFTCHDRERDLATKIFDDLINVINLEGTR